MSPAPRTARLLQPGGFLATIIERTIRSGEKRFEVQVRLAGQRPRFATFAKLADAKRWAQREEVSIRDARAFGRSAVGHRTLAEAIDRYLAEHLADLAPSTVRGRRAMLLFWLDQLGAMKLGALRPDHIARALRDLAERGLSPSSANRYLSALSRVLTIASRRWEWVESNVARNVSKSPEPTGRMRFLSEPERDRLLAACKASRSPELYALVYLALATGGRYGELVGLRWEEIDLARGMVTFARTKNRDRRSVKIGGEALAALLALGPQESGRVFERDSHRTAWEGAVERAGIAPFRFHDLRHSAASFLAQSGASLLDIGAILGHRAVATTKRYAHLTQSHLDAVSDRMAEKFLTLRPAPSDPKASD